MSDSQAPTILVVDDDALVLKSIEALFTVESDYKVLAHTRPSDAIEELERTPVDVIIADFLMPEINGLQFLAKARELQPDAIRIMLTGYADKENAIRAINEVNLYHYLEKPWDNNQLLILVRNAVEDKSLRRRLAEKVRALDDLTREHAQLTDRHGLLQREVEMAARVQRSLLPDSFPEVTGFDFHCIYEPCATIGGDYYDCATVDGRALILVADVSGHGVQAALTSMLLKSTFHETTGSKSSLQSMLAQMNRKLCPVLPTGMFAAATLVSLDVRTSQVCVANAGLPYPFVLRDGAELQEIAVGGIPLGLFAECPEDTYDCRELEMSEGDTLLIASDGLFEIRGEGGEQFQDSRLRQVLAESAGKTGRELAKQVLREALEFSSGGELEDDVSVLVASHINSSDISN